MTGTRRVGLVLLAVGVVALGGVAAVLADAHAYQAATRRRLAQAASDDAARPASVEAAAAEPPGDGEPIGEILIPRLGLAAMVVQGDSAATLRRAVGHLPGTALPGEPGNVVLAGHRDTYFRSLSDVKAGDVITIRTRHGVATYVVESTAVVPPTAVEELRSAGGRTLTLITCYPFGYVGPAPNRFVVRARQADAS